MALNLPSQYNKDNDNDNDDNSTLGVPTNKINDYINKYPIGSPSSVIENHNKDFDVCGVGNYVKRDYWRQDTNHIHPCQKCPPGMNKDEITEIVKGIYNRYDRNKINNIPTMNKELENAGVPYAPARPEDIGHMCSSNIYEWFPKQNDAKPYARETNDIAGMGDWTRIKTAINTEDGNNVSEGDKNLLKQWYVDRMDEGDLNDEMNELKWGLNINKEERLNKFKEEISKDRGSTVKCTPSPPSWLPLTNLSDEQRQQLEYIQKNGCSDNGYFGPKYIIDKEYEDWSRNYLFNENRKTTSMENSSTLMGSYLLPVDKGFEICVNDLLKEKTDTPEHDLRMIRSIHKKDSIYKLTNDEILYIKNKLNMLFLPEAEEGIIDCINRHLLPDKSICTAGLTEQMHIILHVLFSVIGFHFNLEELNEKSSPKHKKRLMFMINELGDIIPKALQRIVSISKKMETSMCDNKVSNNTLVLENLYDHLFSQKKHVFSFDLGLDKLTSSDTSDTEFNRTTVLAMLGIAFLKYF